MSKTKRPLRLNLFLAISGHHQTAWRQPEAQPERSFDIDYYIELAQKAEAAKFDSLFMADRVAAYITRNGVMGGLEPFIKFAAVTAVTKRIGVIITASTTYNEPYHVARKLATLDHVSKGRAAWNIVTSRTEEEAHNFGREEHPGHRARYERAKEFVEVTKKLWDSWDDDALIYDKRNGALTHSDRVRPIYHRGAHFSVEGPLNVPRPIQGYPVLVQAGASEDGRDFAAQTAEAIFTAQHTFEDAHAFYQDVKSRLPQFGREPEDVVILPGLSFFLGETEHEAQEKEARLQEMVNPELGRSFLSNLMHVDLTPYSLDDRLPYHLLPNPETIKSDQGRFTLVRDIALREDLTIRQVILRFAGGRGHNHFVGTPLQMADHMEEWLERGAADGFNLMPALVPDSLDIFIERVLPELRRRDLFRTEYEGTTLRDHYGLRRPANQFTNQTIMRSVAARETQPPRVPALT